jgi:hypothetical protein
MSGTSQHPVIAMRGSLPIPSPPDAPAGLTTQTDPAVSAWDRHGMPPYDPAVVLQRTVVSRDGYRFVSDEINHRVQMVSSAGKRRDLGGAGSGPGQFQYPRGLALLSTDSPVTSRLYVCDAWNHRVQVFDGRGVIVGAFGGRGSGPGQLDVPSDIVLVRPQFAGDEFDSDDPEGLMLAVADSWNGRVQVFDLDGTCVAVVGGERDTTGNEGEMQLSGRQGWPFLRTGSHPVLTLPTGLNWNAPHLEVRCARGVVERIDLAHAMLPRFSTWRSGCREPSLDAARACFRDRAGGPDLPAAALAQIETDLGRALLARRDIPGAASLWAEAWPAGLTRPVMESQLEQRCQQMMPLVGRRGGAELVRAVAASVAQLRHACPAAISTDGSQSKVSRKSAPLAPEGGHGSGRLLRLLTQAAERAGARSSSAEVIWTAPDGERSLGPLAVDENNVALVSSRARALWVFDRTLSPVRRVSLDRSLGPSCLTAHPHGGWLVGDEGLGRLIRVDGAQHRVERGWSGQPTRYHAPVAMTASHDRLYVAEAERDRVVVQDLSGRVLGGFRDIAGPLSLAVDDQCLWISASRPAGLRCLDLTTGHSRVSLQHQALISPVQIAPVGNGTLLVADASAGCVHLFTTTGEWLGQLDEVDGGPLGRPSGVAVLDDTTGLVADRQHGRLIRFELPTLETGWWQL